MSDIAILVGTSPSTLSADDHAEMIKETIASATAFPELADSQVIIAADGVADCYQGLADDYEKALQQVVWWANETSTVEVVLAPTWLHQARTLRLGLDRVAAPFMLVMEHDAPLLPVPIDWAGCIETLMPHPTERAELDVIRFLHESQWFEHLSHLTVAQPSPHTRIPYWAVAQWSQRPHLARKMSYRKMLDFYFSPAARAFVEDVMHGVCDYEWREHGRDGWDRCRIGVYADPDPTYQRSTHVDGRHGMGIPEPFYDYPNHDTPDGAPRATLALVCARCGRADPPGLRTVKGERFCDPECSV